MGIFSPNNIDYIANWCTILAFLGLSLYAGNNIRVKKITNNSTDGDNNKAAITKSGHIDQGTTIHFEFHGQVSGADIQDAIGSFTGSPSGAEVKVNAKNSPIPPKPKKFKKQSSQL